MGFYDAPNNPMQTVVDLMKRSMLEEEINAESVILKHKEGIDIKISDIDDFPNPLFKVIDNEAMKCKVIKN